MILPSNYEFKEGISNPLYKQYDGMNKISYSQIGSFLDYKGDYIMQKFLGVQLDSGQFALWGSQVGDYLNLHDLSEQKDLSEEDRQILDGWMEEFYKDKVGLQFETEIVVDLRPFGCDAVLQGFSDIQWQTDGLTNIVDNKTLNLDTKAKYYASEDYKQLQIYGFGLEEMGHKIGETYVIGFGRKGSTINGNGNYKMRLSGDIRRIDNPYNRELALKAMEEITEVCKKIDEYYSVYLRLLSYGN